MATKADTVLTFFLLLSVYLVHSATAARTRVIWLTPSPPMTGRTAWLTPSPPLPRPEHSDLAGDKDTSGTLGEPLRAGTTLPTRGNPYTRRGATRGSPYTGAPAPGIPATTIPSEPAVSYPALSRDRPAARCRYYKSCRGGGPPGKP